jgi:hypothetical protein
MACRRIVHPVRPLRRTHMWSGGFVIDRVDGARPIKMLGLSDELTDDAPPSYPVPRMSSHDAVATLANEMTDRDVPESTRSENGVETLAAPLSGEILIGAANSPGTDRALTRALKPSRAPQRAWGSAAGAETDRGWFDDERLNRRHSKRSVIGHQTWIRRNGRSVAARRLHMASIIWARRRCMAMANLLNLARREVPA